MAFKSLFIGINEYQSPLISNLSCSARDARALHALFGDSFGVAESVLLTDAQATRAAILENITKLHGAARDDVVVIGFSGHGSDSHHLISCDADPLALDTTAIHLDELTELFARIPAANLALLLDCCFAGGAGAKVFHAPLATKAPASAEALLEKISGRGRLIFAAATADQEAIEDRRRGYSLFTFFVLQALKGAPEIVRAGKLPMLPLVDFVTRSVVHAARQVRHEQEPTLKGVTEGELTFPVLTPGAIYKSYFPDRSPTPVGGDIGDLAQFGFPPPTINAWRESIPSLNELQQQAINKAGLFEGQHIVVSAPTSSGKTMIGEVAALHAYSKGERTYMLFPLRALVSDKYGEFREKYGALGLRVIRSTGEIADDNDALIRGKFDIALLTYERFAAIAVTLPHILRQVGVLVVDEVQMITDRTRGANLEFVLTLLKSQRLFGIEPQLLTLSAVIGDTNGFESWLDARLLRTTKRPVPLEEGVIDLNGTFRYLDAAGAEHVISDYVQPEQRKGSSQDVIVPLVRQLVSAGEKVIVFRETKPIVRATAEYLKQGLGLGPATETLAQLPTSDPSAASLQLKGCLEHGVAFHNSDLDREERHAIESTFRDPGSSLKVLVATTTLAMGVNTPAWSVIIAGLEHPGGAAYGVAEYKNMVGRAGRLGYTAKGKSFLVAATANAYYLWNTYVLGEPEALVSRFADQDPLSLVCRILATARASRASGLSEQDLLLFIQSSFANHHGAGALDESQLKSTVFRLKEAGLIEALDDRYRLTELGKVAGEFGINVESVVRVARALRGLSQAHMTDATFLAVAQVTVELDDVIFPLHKKSVQERQRWRNAIQQQRLPHSVERELAAADDTVHTSRCKRLSAVLMWIEGVDLSQIEASILQHMPDKNAAGPIRATSERTRDVLGVVTRIGALVSTDPSEPATQADDLALRLELGIPMEMCWLARNARRGLERGEYLALRRAGLTSTDTANAIDDTRLDAILGSTTKRSLVRDAIEVLKKAKPADTSSLPMPTPPPAHT